MVLEELQVAVGQLMTKHVWLDRRIAAAGPYLTLVLSQEEFDAALRDCGAPVGKDWLGEHANASAHYLRDKAGDLVCVVALGAFSERSPIEVAGLLVHEAVHVWQKYAENIGEDCPGAEQEAYAIQAISQELMAEFARRIA
jgi:hypothetical protein